MPSLLPVAFAFQAQELIARKSLCQLLELVGPKSYIISHSLGGKYPILVSNDCPQYIAATINLEPAVSPFWRYGLTLGGSRANAYGFTESFVDYDPPIANISDIKIISVGDETLAHRNCFQQVEPVHKLPKISSVPYLMITSQASVHVTYDFCTINYLKQVGGNPEHILLEDIGIFGNGHFMYMELNNLKVANVVNEWIMDREYEWDC
jgi:hypothetical protein